MYLSTTSELNPIISHWISIFNPYVSPRHCAPEALHALCHLLLRHCLRTWSRSRAPARGSWWMGPVRSRKDIGKPWVFPWWLSPKKVNHWNTCNLDHSSMKALYTSYFHIYIPGLQGILAPFGIVIAITLPWLGVYQQSDMFLSVKNRDTPKLWPSNKKWERDFLHPWNLGGASHFSDKSFFFNAQVSVNDCTLSRYQAKHILTPSAFLNMFPS